jgi:hypothetical protein
MGTRSTTTSTRPAGSLQRITRRARGREYPAWRWRTYRRGDLGWERVDLQLGEELSGLRTRTLVALGRLSAPLLVERWARWAFRRWEDLPAWTGPAKGRSHQRAQWWVELPRDREGQVRLRFRSLERGGYDFRMARSVIREAEETATAIWRRLTDDPVLELGRLLWLEGEGRQRVDAIAEEQLELRRQRRRGELSQRDYEADERGSYLRLEGWEEMVATVQRRHDELLEQVVAAAVRTEREEIRRQVLARVDRHLHDGRQQARWRADHWDGRTLSWSC